MFPVADLAAYLAGHWRVERSLADLSNGGRGAFCGTASFDPADDGTLIHRESGELVWGSHRGPAYRRLRMRPAGDPGRLEAMFEDGRRFHLLDLRAGTATVEHPCGPDAYVGEFEVASADAWAYCWTVTGPRKSLRLSSSLTRL